MIEDLRRKLAHNNNFSFEDMSWFLESAISEEITDANKIEILTLQNNKGISADELVYAVEHLQKNVPSSDVIDICGTGGSGLPRINTSTLSAFVLAVLGVRIAKHGNRAVSGCFGSFDLLEKLGIRIDLTHNESKNILEECSLGFFFAPKCYPEIGAFSLVRKCLEKPTMFNLLGPLLSPLNPHRQVIGASNKKNVQLIAEAAKKLGREKIYVLVGSDGLDEVTTTGDTYLVNEKGDEEYLAPEDFGVPRVSFSDISGGDSEKNLQIAKRFLSGENAHSPHANLVHVNVALALRLAGKELDLKKGTELSREAVENGAVQKMFEKIRDASQKI